MKTTQRHTESGTTAVQYGRSQPRRRKTGHDVNVIRTLGAAAVTAVAAGGLALGLAGLGLFTGIGTAAADGHNILDQDGTWGAPDGAQKRGNSFRPADHTVDLSDNVPPLWPAAPSWPASPTWPAPPSWGSHPADPAWPGNGWGVADN